VIRDVAEFTRTGVVWRRVDDLGIPVGAWRAAMCHAGRRSGARVRTFMVPSAASDAGGASAEQLVFAVRTDPPPDPAAQRQGLLRWWRVDELNMPFDRWRAALRRVGRRQGVPVHTFLVPPPSASHNHRDQVVYAVWAEPADVQDSAVPPCTVGTARPAPLRPVTYLAEYAATRSLRAVAMADHPSRSVVTEDDEVDP
jgi:hypothetical protein